MRRIELIWRTPEFAPRYMLTITPERVTVKVPYGFPLSAVERLMDVAGHIAKNLDESLPSLRAKSWNPWGTETLLVNSGGKWGVIVDHNAEQHTYWEKEEA